MAVYDVELDATGLICPMPLLKAKKCLHQMQSGQVLRVVSTDPTSVDDFNAFVTVTQHQLIDMVEIDDQYYFYLKKN